MFGIMAALTAKLKLPNVQRPQKPKAQAQKSGRKFTIQQMCQEMVESDLQDAKRHALLKPNGYPVNVSLE